ncbi:MAG: hypothetical protein M0013_08870 [Actinomycetota bacterium]|nr:hypothetical protein [Actinomycetota bacterium]
MSAAAQQSDVDTHVTAETTPSVPNDDGNVSCVHWWYAGPDADHCKMTGRGLDPPYCPTAQQCDASAHATPATSFATPSANSNDVCTVFHDATSADARPAGGNGRTRPDTTDNGVGGTTNVTATTNPDTANPTTASRPAPPPATADDGRETLRTIRRTSSVPITDERIRLRLSGTASSWRTSQLTATLAPSTTPLERTV